MNGEISAYAHEIAKQERLITEANEVYQSAKKQSETLRKRVELLEAERDKIINIRANGNETEENENRLVVISFDLKGLEPLAKKAHEETAKAFEPITLAKENLNNAKENLKIAQAGAEHEALTAKAREIEQLLINVVKEVHESGKRAGSPHFLNNYTPPNNLVRLIRDRVLPK